MIFIELNEAEQKLAEYLGKARHKNARNRNIEDRQVGPQSAEETGSMGGELAGCKYMNVYPDLSIPAEGELDPADAVLRTGQTVDVKTTPRTKGRLLAALWKEGEKSCDLYLLMIEEFPRYRVAGFATRDEIFRDETVVDLGHGPVHAIDQEFLAMPPLDQSVEDWQRELDHG